MAMVMPSKVPTRKLIASAAGGAVLGAPLAEIIVYVIELLSKGDIPDRIETAIAALLIPLAGFAVGYATPPASEDVPVVDRG